MYATGDTKCPEQLSDMGECALTWDDVLNVFGPFS
jgi:hypothetical protein